MVRQQQEAADPVGAGWRMRRRWSGLAHGSPV